MTWKNQPRHVGAAWSIPRPEQPRHPGSGADRSERCTDAKAAEGKGGFSMAARIAESGQRDQIQVRKALKERKGTFHPGTLWEVPWANLAFVGLCRRPLMSRTQLQNAARMARTAPEHAGGPHVFRAPGRRQQADAVCAHGAQSEQNKAADNVCWAFHAFPLSGFAAEYLGKGTARWECVCVSRLRGTAPAVAGPLFVCMPPRKQ